MKGVWVVRASLRRTDQERAELISDKHEITVILNNAGTLAHVLIPDFIPGLEASSYFRLKLPGNLKLKKESIVALTKYFNTRFYNYLHRR